MERGNPTAITTAAANGDERKEVKNLLESLLNENLEKAE